MVADAQQLAGAVQVTRSRFEQIYDGVTQEVRADNTGKVPDLFKSVVLGDDYTSPANDIIAFRRAFEAARLGGWLKHLIRRCLENAALDTTILQSVSPPAAPAPASAPTQRTVQQAAFDLAQGFPQPNLFASGLLRVVPKMCLVSARLAGGKRSQGTGFLIGPQTVLTAWHVIQPLLDPVTRQPAADSHKSLSVEFDYVEDEEDDAAAGPHAHVRTYGVVQDWLLENSPCHNSEKPSADGMPSETLDTTAICSDFLDFAVIRLNGSPGRERGVVKLRPQTVSLPNGQGLALLLFQHPLQFALRFAPGELCGFFGGGEPRPRLRHKANTEKGSSGGLCVDAATFEALGLHQATVVDGDGKPIVNQAIPTALIVPQLGLAFAIDPALDPVSWLKPTNEPVTGTVLGPVLGRDGFQESVWKLVRGEKRIIVVRGLSRSGKTFSKYLLNSMLPPADTLIVEIAVEKIGRDIQAFMADLLQQCGTTVSADDPLPDADAAATTPEAWLRDQLAPDLLRRVRETIGDKQVWIVIDNLDRYDMPEGQPRDLLYALMVGTAVAPSLRFLLIGAKSSLSGVPQELIEHETFDWPLADDVDTFLQRRTADKPVPMAKAVRQLVVKQVMDNSRRNAPENQCEAAARFILEHVVDVLPPGVSS